jgi:hypothetical protein
MNKSLAAVVTMFTLAALPQSAYGQIQFQANITHDQEVITPGIPNEGSSGFGVFTLNAAQTQLTYDVTLTGLDLDNNQTPGNPNDNVTRVHFHRAPAGSNGGIVYGIIDASALLRNDINPNDLIVNAATGRITGKWDLGEGANNNGTTTLATELPFLLTGGLYFNVHTSDHGGGEIRGQVLLVPEPASLTLFLLGATPLCMRRRRT